MKKTFILITLCLCFMAIPVLAFQQNTGVTAESQALVNLRANTSIEADLVGEVTPGTRYPVLGRNEFYPWLLLGDPTTQTPIGWVFAELVSVQGNVNQLPFSTVVIDGSQNLPTPSPSPSATPQTTEPVSVATEAPLVGVAIPVQPTATAEITSNVWGQLRGEVNIRLGPGVEYDRLGTGRAGDRFPVTAWHTQLPWLQVAYANSPNGYAWIASDLLEVEGDVFSLPSITQTNLNLPTLTPTPPLIQSSSLTGDEPVDLSPQFMALGQQLWDHVLANGFDPETRRFGALFIMDLETGENLTFGSDFAFSGTSINKIGIMDRLYRSLNAPPNEQLAVDIANTMICSENVATNRLLSTIGGGDPYLGASEVTAFYRQMGMSRSFLTAPYTIPGSTPVPPSNYIELPTTSADQTKANADLSNQITVDEIGFLLAGIYQCAYQDSGPLLELYPGEYEPRECRQMLHVMTNNNVDALLRAGVPEEIPVAHKHGWIDDTHGNAALFFTPGGDYVIVMMLHEPTWLNFTESLPVIADVSRQVYNHYNPNAQLDEVREGFIPATADCNFRGSPLIDDIMAAVFEPPARPTEPVIDADAEETETPEEANDQN